MYGKPARRLYVLELTDGVIKGGIAVGTAGARLSHHKSKLGATLARHYIGEALVTGIEAEVALLKRLGAIGSIARGREWFTGVSFAEAAAIVREVTNEFIAPDQSPRVSPNLRRKTAAVNFNDQELALIDAYCAKFGLERAVACRQLAMEAIAKLIGGQHQKILPQRLPESC